MPSASDAVIFDGVGTGDSPCTIAANAVCLSMVCGGYTNTITHNAVTLTVSGSITFVAGMTYTTVGISVIEMDATGTFTSAGKEPYKFQQTNSANTNKTSSWDGCDEQGNLLHYGIGRASQ